MNLTYRIFQNGLAAVIFSALSLLPANSQGYSARKINWLGAVKFDAGYYPGATGSLPHYSERLPFNDVNSALKPEVFLTNLQFEPVPEDQEMDLPDELKNLSEEITVKTFVQTERKKDFARFSFMPFRRNPLTGRAERLVAFTPDLRLVPAGEPSLKSIGRITSYTSQSVLAEGNWYKIRVSETGVHKLTYQDLQSIGIKNPANVRVYGNGGKQLAYNSNIDRPDDLLENPIYLERGSDGTFNSGDYLLFFATGPVSWKYESTPKTFSHRIHLYSDFSYYFLTEDLGPGKQISREDESSLTPQTDVTTYDAYDYREKDSLNLIKTGRQWCWTHYATYLKHGFTFDFPHRVVSEPVKVTAALWARSARTSSNSKFYIQDGDTRFATVELPGVNTNNYEALYASSAVSNSQVNPAGDRFTINIQFIPSNPAAEGWLDYLTLNTRCSLVFDEGQMLFRDSRSSGPGKTARFRIEQAKPGCQIWDVTESTNVRQMVTKSDGSLLEFAAATDQIREYVILDPSSAALPVPAYSGDGLGPVPNQNLHGLEAPDMVILVHEELKSYAQDLAAFHSEKDGITSLVITPQQVYNEFSSGIRDVTAIRDFLKMFYDRASGNSLKLKYFLFFGDGSYDNKSTAIDFITCLPTYQSLESLYPTSSYITDDFFGLLDTGEELEPGLLDLGIGRFPVTTENEASVIMQKIKQYYEPAAQGDWRNLICFIGDDEDGNAHMRDANALAEYLREKYPAFNLDKIFLDAYQQSILPAGERYPDVNRAINDRMKKGALIMNYLGHGSERGLAHEEILTISDIKNWDNNIKLPLFMTATCEFSRFDDVSLVSAGEWVLLNPAGGGIALFSTSRLVYSSPNYFLNREFYNFVFERDQQGNRYSLGDVMRLTKNAVGEEQNKLNFTLLGDPALKLSFPEYRVEMTGINGKPLAEFTDTLKALSQASVRGYVTDLSGNRIEDFNGQVLPTIYDKEMTMTNLANDGGPVMEFIVQNSILFKGKASVANGEFGFSFIVPKDIAYNVDRGKFSFYASDAYRDASGVNQGVLIGGSGGSNLSDSKGPEMKVYMNDSTFVGGGITNENPVLFIRVRDDSGINTTGNGIGHDITAILDGNLQNVLVLNDYYESDLDNYRAGSIKYPLSKLEPGDHNIRVKVWDVLNNSTEADLAFRVISSGEITIDHVLNYPNPFTTHTDFYFEHNQGQQAIEVLLQVFTISGKLVKSFEFLTANDTQISPGSFRVGPVSWDGLDDFGDRIGRGTYFYRIRLRTADGKLKEAYQKLVILK